MLVRAGAGLPSKRGINRGELRSHDISPSLLEFRAPSPPGALRTERDRLVVANDELRLLCEQKDEQLSDITATLVGDLHQDTAFF